LATEDSVHGSGLMSFEGSIGRMPFHGVRDFWKPAAVTPSATAVPLERRSTSADLGAGESLVRCITLLAGDTLPAVHLNDGPCFLQV
jgi:hypothetical protein